jgi:hypothetical protein
MMSANSKVWYNEEVGDRDTEKSYGLCALCAVKI